MISNTIQTTEPEAGVPAAMLGAQIRTLAAQLWAIAEIERGPSGAATVSRGIDGDAQQGYRDALIAAVEHEYNNRRERERVLDSSLFGEPAWDMLLYLYAARLRGSMVPTGSLVKASGVPPTTALRWIAHLERLGLVERCMVKQDGRIRLQKLTRRAVDQLETHFRARLTAAALSGEPQRPIIPKA